MHDHDDDEIMREVQKGDATHYAVIVARYSKAIYMRIAYIVQNHDMAQDLAQDVFVRVWQKAKHYKCNGHFRAWLFAVARNAALDYVRTKKDVPFSAFETEDGINMLFETVADGEPSRSATFSQEEDMRQIAKLMEKLSLHEQKTISLYYGEAMTFAEVGEALQKPLHTVKSHHRRGLEKLRRLWGRWGGA